MNGHFTINISRGGKPLANFEFKNMILQSGYEYILNNTAANNTTTVINQCLLGNGTTEPEFSDTTLSGETVGVISLINSEKYFTSYYDQWSNGGYDDDILVHKHYFKTKATTFATISEIATAISDGVNAPILFSKTLLRDKAGRTVSYNVGPGDDIDVTYTFLKKRDRVLYTGTTHTLTTSESNRYPGTSSPLTGVRNELNLWSIDTLTESASKAGCTWSIDFDTSRMAVEKKFDIIFNLEYVQGSAGYDTFYNPGNKPYFKFYYTIFNTRYLVGVQTLTADQLSNGRKISIRQTFRIADIESWFGVNLLGFNQHVQITSTGSRLDRGDHALSSSYSGASLPPVLFKRYIKPFTPVFGQTNGAAAATYNGYIWYEGMDILSDYNAKYYGEILTDTEYVQFEKQPLALYCSNYMLSRERSGFREHRNTYVNHLVLHSTKAQDYGDVHYFVDIVSWVIGLLNPMQVRNLANDIQILVNGQQLRYFNTGSFYNSNWYLPIIDEEITNYSELFGKTKPVVAGDEISIVMGENTLTFINPTYNSTRHQRVKNNTLNNFSETAKATASLHSGFYGE